MNCMDPSTEELFRCIRKLIRTYDQHASSLRLKANVSSPQLLLMHAIADLGQVPAKELAEEICVTQGTATVILKQLEIAELAQRMRSREDRRKISVKLTDKGKSVLEKAPPLLHQEFISRFQELKPSEKTNLLYCFQRVNEMMEASMRSQPKKPVNSAERHSEKASEPSLNGDSYPRRLSVILSEN